jgi:hypothetical protein
LRTRVMDASSWLLVGEGRVSQRFVWRAAADYRIRFRTRS